MKLLGKNHKLTEDLNNNMSNTSKDMIELGYSDNKDTVIGHYDLQKYIKSLKKSDIENELSNIHATLVDESLTLNDRALISLINRQLLIEKSKRKAIDSDKVLRLDDYYINCLEESVTEKTCIEALRACSFFTSWELEQKKLHPSIEDMDKMGKWLEKAKNHTEGHERLYMGYCVGMSLERISVPEAENLLDLSTTLSYIWDDKGTPTNPKNRLELDNDEIKTFHGGVGACLDQYQQMTGFVLPIQPTVFVLKSMSLTKTWKNPRRSLYTQDRKLKHVKDIPWDKERKTK